MPRTPMNSQLSGLIVRQETINTIMRIKKLQLQASELSRKEKKLEKKRQKAGLCLKIPINS